MKIGIIGTGAYGIALASSFYENNCDITMWTKFSQEKEELDKKRTNNKVLKNVKVPKEIKFTTSIEEVMNNELIVIAIPAAYVSDTCKEMKKYYKNQHICIASKGIEQGSCLFIKDIIDKYIKTKNIAVISGGTFAIDIINKNPVGLSLATKNKQTEKIIKNSLETKHLKLRTTNDILGIEICGSIKNVIAIASGILEGLGYAESTKCMLITESLHDIKSLISNLGGNKKTILSYAGFGDLLLTCTSTKSRNYSFGKLLGEKKSKEEIDNYINNTTIEGLYTLKSIHKLIKNKKVSMPIINLIYDIVFKDKDPNSLAEFLIEKE